MGFHLRKTFKAGLFNFNLSNSGIGSSFGIKGLRFGLDGKGRAYIGGGKGILRYRKYLSSSKNASFNFSTPDKGKKNKIGCFGFGFLLTVILCFLLPPLGAFLLILFVYFLPWVLADIYNLKNTKEIYLINFLTGWTGVGWIIAFTMSLFGIIKNRNIHKLEHILNVAECDDIENILNDLISLNPAESTRYKLKAIEIYKENKEFQKGLNLLESSYLGETRQLKMQLLEGLERYQDVISMLQKDFTEEEKEEHPALYAFMAEMFLKLNQPELAIESLKQGPINAQKMTDELCVFRYALGKCYESINDIENAKKQYSKVYVFNADFEDVKEKMENLQ